MLIDSLTIHVLVHVPSASSEVTLISYLEVRNKYIYTQINPSIVLPTKLKRSKMWTQIQTNLTMQVA